MGNFSFSTLRVYLHCPLICTVSCGKSVVILLLVPLNIMCLLPKDFILSLVFEQFDYVP